VRQKVSIPFQKSWKESVGPVSFSAEYLTCGQINPGSAG
jgi:hypothetical protein